MIARIRLGFAIAGVLALVVAPLVVSDGHTLRFAAVGAYAIAILGVDILLGQSGRVSLGQGAFMAVGGYATAILMSQHGVRDLVALPAAGAIAGGIALLAGIPALRLGGRSLVVATLGGALAVPTLALRFPKFTGGGAGLTLFGRPTETGQGLGVSVLGVHLSNADWLYALVWAIAAVAFLLARAVVGSRFGRSLRAVADNDLAALVSGVNCGAHRLGAFVLAAVYAGVAGSLLVLVLAQVRPGTFPLRLSLLLVAAAVVCGSGSIGWAAAGALLVEYIGDLAGLLPHVDASDPGPPTFVLGALVICAALLLRVRGIVATRRYARAK